MSTNIEQHFGRTSPHVRAIYDLLLNAANGFGPFLEDPKKTSIHLNRRSAFAGIITRKDSLDLTFKSTCDIENQRIRKREQVSANRWHIEVKLNSPDEIDAEITKWLNDSYEISG